MGILNTILSALKNMRYKSNSPAIRKASDYLTKQEYQPKRASYGFFTSFGGVSEDETHIIDKKDATTGNITKIPVQTAFGSLNVGVATKDKPENIIENIKIAYNQILATNHKPLNSWLFINETTYSNKVLTITDENIEALKQANKYPANSPFAKLNQFCTRVQCDGFVTKSPKAILSTVSGDAHSIVLIDEKTGVIGVMAGSWKGIAKGLYENMVDSMKELGADPKNITTIIGPGLGKGNYEFGAPDAAKYFFGNDSKITDLNKEGKPADPNPDGSPVYYRPSPAYQQFFQPKGEGKCNIDFPGLIAFKGQQMGLGKVHDLGVDTLKDPRVFGARRGLQEYGRPHDRTGRNLNFATLANKPFERSR